MAVELRTCVGGGKYLDGFYITSGTAPSCSNCI